MIVVLVLIAPGSAAGASYIAPSFTDADRGSIIRNDALLVTNDGGASWWHIPNVRQAVTNPTGPWYAISGRTVRRGSASTKHWPVVARFAGTRMLAFAARSTGAWAVTKPCPRCHLRLWHSFDAGSTWFYTDLRDSQRNNADDKDARTVLSFADAADGMVLYLSRHEGMVTRSTSDGGHTWSGAHPQPAARASVSAANDGSIWLGSGLGPGAPYQPRSIKVSTDGGRSFDLRARDNGPGTHPVGNIGHSGALYGLAAASRTTAYAEVFKGGGVLKTTDGGRHWRRLHPYAYGDGTGLSGVSAVGDHVWAAQISLGLYVSKDGGRRWRHVSIPRR